MPDDRIYDAINLFKYSRTGQGNAEFGGDHSYRAKYRRLARDVVSRLWTLWERDEIDWRSLDEGIVGDSYPDRPGPDIRVTDRFDMEIQPHLLLLQKTMVVAEGVGRSLNPDVNMWELARPLIEDWMRENRGPEARLKHAARDLAVFAERLPTALGQAERILEEVSEGGIRLHPDTVQALAETQARLQARRRRWLIWPLVVAGIVAAAIAAL